ncbi:ankyrin repeat domain-containing protein 50 [Biomphalaria pfeifferi]|uniref:Ankyrin repeat domain-containing protein 50 n=1 Tax=Biomphalaria pfeifferi TaxID=112525 RepID=A0AAD8F4K5_BIOPF|nr:ankyrin repeat domain-containing protein 50 [Biomphalaria pfeifferi]
MSLADVDLNMAEPKDPDHPNDSILFKTIASSCFPENHELLRLCDHKTTHAMNLAVPQASRLNIGHAHLLQFLLHDGTRLKPRDDNTLLIFSAQDFLYIMDKLLRLDAVGNARNNVNATSSLGTSREVIQFLLVDRSLNADEQNQTRNTAFMSAVETSHIQNIKLLTSAGDSQDGIYWVLLNWSKEDLDCFPLSKITLILEPYNRSITYERELRQIAPLNVLHVTKRTGLNKLLEMLSSAKLVSSIPLHLVADENDFGLSTSVLFNRFSENTETILSKKGFPSIAGKILSSGPDVIAKNNKGDTAHTVATSRDVIQCFQSGWDKLQKLLCRAKSMNSNPLQLAAVENDFETCTMLLKCKLCDKEETQNLRPDILCYIFRQIQQRDAILSSALEFVRELCRLGMNVNRCQCCTTSRIDFALRIGSYELAEILCAHGARVTHENIVSAVKRQRIHVIPLLVNYGTPVNKCNHRGHITYKDSALDVALENSLTSAARVLLQHGAQLDAECAVTQALKSNNTKTLMYLLTECTEQIKAMIVKPETLIQAVQLGEIQFIQLLLDSGADIDGVHYNKTPLMSAVHIEVINFLLNKGADVNLKTNTTPLINAISCRYFNYKKLTFHSQLSSKEIEEQTIHVIDLFLRNGAKLEDTDEIGCTALIKSPSVEVLKYLIDKGAEVNRQDNKGLTALHIASKYCTFDFVNVLIKYGALVNLKSHDGSTPLHQAVRNEDIVKLLLENQANVNLEDNLGNTPLSLASDDHVVKLLIASGADVNHRNSSGMSPLWLAAENYNTKCLEILVNAKANLDHDDYQKKSALSLVLNKWLPHERVQRTANVLLDHQASVAFVRPDVIHRLIAACNDSSLVQKIMKSGISPTDIVLQQTIFNWPETSVSPLAVSLILDSLDFVSYFIENWYLTKSDIKILSGNQKIIDGLQHRDSRALSYLEEVSRQPMRLELLCFITVSSALGSDQGRRQRVHNSKLPLLIQDMLLFSKLEVKVLLPNSGNGIKFLYQLTKNQVKQEDTESSFYEMFEDFSRRRYRRN